MIDIQKKYYYRKTKLSKFTKKCVTNFVARRGVVEDRERPFVPLTVLPAARSPVLPCHVIGKSGKVGRVVPVAFRNGEIVDGS